jgi:hypothetical protein
MSYKSFLQYYYDHEQLPLSDTQLQSILNDKTRNVVVYHTLNQIQNVNQLFGDRKSIILLHENTRNSGHYCCLLKKEDTNGYPYVEYWDSFGDNMESSIDKFKYEKFDYLTQIMNNSIEQGIIRYVVQNKKPFQTDRLKTQTCGRWSAFRILHQDLDLEQFNKLLIPINKVMRYDIFITLLTDFNIRYN